MKKLTILLSLMLLSFSGIRTVAAQENIAAEETWQFTEISGSNYHGFAFHKDWEVDFTVENEDGRYTPTNEDIIKAEKLLHKRIAYLNRNHENQEGMCPLIDEHMNKYERQYVGFTDVYGHHIVWINCLWDETVKGRLHKDIILTEGGCGHYWRVKVNVDTEKIYGLEVNEAGNVKYLPRVKKPKPRISRPKPLAPPQRYRKTGIIHSPEEKVF